MEDLTPGNLKEDQKQVAATEVAVGWQQSWWCWRQPLHQRDEIIDTSDSKNGQVETKRVLEQSVKDGSGRQRREVGTNGGSFSTPAAFMVWRP